MEAFHRRADGFGGEYGSNLAIAAERLFQQMKAHRHAKAVLGSGPPEDRFADFLEQRISWAR